ncbi:conserved Plasmodium protein, unknown function [Plasmodium ovale curtisi]|uniref:Uncharacterized protein n=1 Tax=Plasmodium ovale curtisi TaxID=864141 RepID=A0A1A8X946_PLAOA|nr:conserved Plasmodium protein, unknown function [Plasmodium ovale curtisi]
MNVDIAFDGNEYTYSGFSKNSLIEDKNYTLDYDKYVHFAFFTCYYISHIKKERCSDTEILTCANVNARCSAIVCTIVRASANPIPFFSFFNNRYLKTFKHIVINVNEARDAWGHIANI